MTALRRALTPSAIALAVIALLLGLRSCTAPRWRDHLNLTVTTDGTITRDGFIKLPRGGPFVFGFQSASGQVSITIGEHSVTRGGPGVNTAAGNVVTRRIVFESPGAVRFSVTEPATGATDLRLLWHPPGRRGAPEYLPAAILSRTPIGGGSPRSLVDGLVALGILATLIALGFHYLRPRLRATPRQVRRAAGAVLVIALAIRMFGLGAAGQTWDEDENWSSGRNYISNVVALDGDQSAWIWNLEHPPVMKYLAGVGAQFADGFGPSRALSALMVAAACALIVLIGSRLLSPRAGLIAGVVAALLPPLIAHAQVVGHEAPTLLWWSLGLWLALGAFDHVSVDDRTTWRRLTLRLVGLGVVLGVAIASRFVNGLLAPLLGAVLLVSAPRGLRARVVTLGLAIMPLVAVITMVALWPRLWSMPFTHLAESWARLSKPHGAEPWLGSMTNTPGPAYFVIYIFATAPIAILVGIVAWKARVAVALRRRTPGEVRAALILTLLFLAPLGVMVSPVRQDGVRYVLPSLLALSLMAGAGFDALATWLTSRFGKFAAPALLAVVVLQLGLACVRIAPYYLDYFGEHMGGPAGVQARRSMETAWWGEGLDRAIDYVNSHAEPGAKVHRGCVEPGHLTWFRGDLWNPMENDARGATWIVTYAPNTHHCKLPPDAKRVFAVSAQGALLAEVWHRANR